MKQQKWTVYIPDFLPPTIPQKEILDPIAKIITSKAKSEDELIAITGKVDAVLITLRCNMTRRVIEASRNLKVISKYGVGLENIDIKAATEAGIPVTNVPGINTSPVAEHTIGLMLAAMRRLQECREHIQKGGWRNEAFLGGELLNSIIGIIGYGNIAKEVIRKLQGFEVKTFLVYTESKTHEMPEFSNVEFVDLQNLLKTSDIVSIHKTLTPKSQGLIGEAELRLMKRTAYLINTSRGPLLEEQALIKALRQEWIAGAGLDVFEKEPLSSDNPLVSMKNVVLTPHIGASTLHSRIKGVSIAASNVADVLQGIRPRPQYFVNPEVWDKKES